VPVGRAFRKFLRQTAQIDGMPSFERGLANVVLLDVVGAAQANRPAVRGLESGSAVGAAPDMGTFDRAAGTARDRAGVIADPGAVSRALP